MSWQQYVDSNLVGTGMVTQAGIYDHVGNPWAYTQNPPFAAQVAEVAAISAAFADPSSLAATGAVVAGVKYMFVRGDESEIYVKKVRDHRLPENTGSECQTRMRHCCACSLPFALPPHAH